MSFVATGGTVTRVGGRRIHTFTTLGASTFTVSSGTTTAQILVVAGGGGGGYDRAGGGGGGGVVYSSAFALSAGSYAITVGDGGAGATTSVANGVNGGNSSFAGVTAAVGGGGGGTYAAGSAGGSGGGGHGQVSYAGGAGTAGQGNAGGAGAAGTAANSGGGGGAGSAGTVASTTVNGAGGGGGNGALYSISGSPVYYGGGGGGSIAFDSFTGTSFNGLGGVGGGGNSGQVRAAAGSAGASNTGGGGGGGANIPQGSGGKGGSGIVIVSYPDPDAGELLYYPTATTLATANTTVTGNATIGVDRTNAAAYLVPSTSNAAAITQWVQRNVNNNSIIGSNELQNPVDTGTNSFNLITYKTGTGISNSTDSPFSSGDTGSLYLRGALGAYAITSTSLVFNWWTVKFTLECWVKYDTFTNAGVNPTLFGNMTASNAALLYWGFGATNSGTLAFYYYYGTGGTQPATTATITAGQWTSIAISCDATNIYLFINGVLSNTSAILPTPQVSTALPFEFCQGINVNLPSVAVANIRYTSGAALYTSTYTPSTTPLGLSPSGTTVLLVNVPNPRSRAQPYWSNAVTFGTASTAPGSASYNGCCIAQDGRVIFAPHNNGAVGVFDPKTNTCTAIAANPPCNGGGYAVGAVLCPDGRILFVPYNGATNAPVTLWNPVTNLLTTVATGITGAAKFQGGCVLPDGRVLLAPNGATCVGVFNPTTNSFLTYGTVPSGAYAGGCCLIPDGRVVFSPNGQTNVGIFNYLTNSYTTATWGFTGTGYTGANLVPDGRVVFTPNGQTNVGVFNPATNSFTTYNTGYAVNYASSCLLPDGRVVFAPLSQSSGSIGLFNPVTNSFSTIIIAPTGIPYAGGCVLLPDGRVIFTPYNALNVGVLAGSNRPVAREFCMHPFFNKS